MSAPLTPPVPPSVRLDAPDPRAEFVRLCDVALGLAEQVRADAVAAGAVPGRLAQIDAYLNQLRGARGGVLKGLLPPPGPRVTRGRLGLSRFGGEAGESHALLDAFYAVDWYYTDRL